MERIPQDPYNKIYIALSIITFILSWVPKIDSTYKVVLLIASVILLCIIYFSGYFERLKKNEEKIQELSKKYEKMEDLINIKTILKC